jgi:hypothetical protein
LTKSDFDVKNKFNKLGIKGKLISDKRHFQKSQLTLYLVVKDGMLSPHDQE